MWRQSNLGLQTPTRKQTIVSDTSVLFIKMVKKDYTASKVYSQMNWVNILANGMCSSLIPVRVELTVGYSATITCLLL